MNDAKPPFGLAGAARTAAAAALWGCASHSCAARAARGAQHECYAQLAGRLRLLLCNLRAMQLCFSQRRRSAAPKNRDFCPPTTSLAQRPAKPLAPGEPIGSTSQARAARAMVAERARWLAGAALEPAPTPPTPTPSLLGSALQGVRSGLRAQPGAPLATLPSWPRPLAAQGARKNSLAFKRANGRARSR